jgi:hypothetical protein
VNSYRSHIEKCASRYMKDDRDLRERSVKSVNGKARPDHPLHFPGSGRSAPLCGNHGHTADRLQRQKCGLTIANRTRDLSKLSAASEPMFHKHQVRLLRSAIGQAVQESHRRDWALKSR